MDELPPLPLHISQGYTSIYKVFLDQPRFQKSQKNSQKIGLILGVKTCDT